MTLFANIPAWAIAPITGTFAVVAVAGTLAWRAVGVEPAPTAPANATLAQPAPGNSVAAAPAAIISAPEVAPMREAAVQPQQPRPVPDAPAKADSAPALSQIIVPTFDIVRAEPSGDVLVAGRGEPGGNIAVVEGDKVLARTTIDGGGQFVLLPPSLKPGSHLLSLQMTDKTGNVVNSGQSVAVAIAEPAKGGVIVALAEPGKATSILSDPAVSPKQVASVAPAQVQQPTPEIAIRSVEVEQGGGFYASGLASAGAHVRLYLNGTYVAAMQANPLGHWSLKIAKGMQPGHYSVRADQVEATSGNVMARAEVPFDYPVQVSEAPVPAVNTVVVDKPPSTAAKPLPPLVLPPPRPAEAELQPAPVQPKQAEPPVPDRTNAASQMAPATVTPAGNIQAVTPIVPAAAPIAPAISPLSPRASLASAADVVIKEIQTATVVRGDSLWRISRNALGQGVRYSQIYEANATQIRNPRLIYPGQVLVLPASP